MPRRNIVYFLGAGFSRAFGYPVMSEFFRVARDSERLTPEQKKYLEDRRRIANSATPILTNDSRNLEQVLSMAVMADRCSTSNATTQQDMATQAIARIYSAPIPNFWNELGRGSELFPPPSSQHNISVITTNYDIITESMLTKLGYYPKLPFSYKRKGSGEYSVFAHGDVLLCKLHGSVNWWSEGSDIFIDDSTAYIYDPDRREVELPRIMSLSYCLPAPPIISPPTFFKETLHKETENNWKAARKALSEADHIVFVGYSFPPSDTYMRYFLGASLYDNLQLENILVIDPAADDVAQRLQQGVAISNSFVSRLTLVPSVWEAASDQFSPHDLN
jgi:hypothetical protein